MMSPYEGERIFEAEMVRLHLCDRSLEGWMEETAEPSQPVFSLRKWLQERLTALHVGKKPEPSVTTEKF